MKKFAAIFAILAIPTVSSAQVTSVYGRTGAVTAQTGDYTCTKVTNCGPTNGVNTWTAQQVFSVHYPSQVGGTFYYPIINGANMDGAVNARTQAIFQVVGSSDVADYGTEEVNVVDAFAYDGIAQFDAERYNRRTVANSSVLSGQAIGTYSFEPFDGQSDSNTAAMIGQATENQDHATGHHGTSLSFTYTPNNSGSNLRYSGITISRGGLGGVTVGDTGYQAPPADLGKGTLNVVSDIATGTHYRSTGAAPIVSACGTSPTIRGTDVAGEVGTGSSVSSCTITFRKAFNSNPICIVQTKANAAPVAFVTSASTTALTVNWNTSIWGGWYYICQDPS